MKRINHLRNPKNLWKSLANLCEGNKVFNSKLEIHLSGNIDVEVIAEIESFSFLKGKVKHLGYLSHAQVLEQYNQVDVLLLLLFNSKSGVGNYPGKIFEYFAARKPILAFGPKNSDAERLIEKTNSGKYFSYNEKNLKNNILALFKKDENFDFENIESFSRKKITHDLANILNSLS